MQELIYNQSKIPKSKWRYGFRSSAATGCGWIATHNALRLMGYPSHPEYLIRYYERGLPLLNGNLGTCLFNIIIFFKQKGFRVKVTTRRSKFDETVKNSDVCILFYFWHKKYKPGAHYVTVHYSDGKFLGYNTFSNSTGPDNYRGSLELFLKKRNYFGAILIAIKNKY